jgi:hypothetical protein
MQSELGKCFLNLAKTLFLLNEYKEGENYLSKAKAVFIAEGNEISVASVNFFEANILFHENNIEAAEIKTKAAVRSFKKGKNIRFELLAKWFLGKIYKTQNKLQKDIFSNVGSRKTQSAANRIFMFGFVGRN